MFKQLSLFLILGLLMAGPAVGHELLAPTTVVADGAGHFSFVVSVEVTVAANNGSQYINGADNTDLGESWADGFCIGEWTPGHYPTIVSGNLSDPGLNGSVFFQHSLCDGWSGSATIDIQAPAVGVQTTRWGALKARYR